MNNVTISTATELELKRDQQEKLKAQLGHSVSQAPELNNALRVKLEYMAHKDLAQEIQLQQSVSGKMAVADEAIARAKRDVDLKYLVDRVIDRCTDPDLKKQIMEKADRELQPSGFKPAMNEVPTITATELEIKRDQQERLKAQLEHSVSQAPELNNALRVKLEYMAHKDLAQEIQLQQSVSGKMAVADEAIARAKRDVDLKYLVDRVIDRCTDPDLKKQIMEKAERELQPSGPKA